MIGEGADAPTVALPGFVNGERKRVDLGEHLGEGIVVIAFYPADFNPACTMAESDLGDLDLFTMQKDVSIFAISPDSTYSHEAFADKYSLHIPLLSDGDGEAARAYDVARTTDLGEAITQRAVFVVDHHGVVQYAWATDDLEERFDVGPVKEAVGSIGGDDTALERYRVGYDHYVAGKEAFGEAMAEYDDREWMAARSGFDEAEPDFTAARDHFDTAVRFAETADFETIVDRAEEKADTLQHAADWLADSADALASGRGKQGKQYREDAQQLLDAAEDLPDPADPDAFSLADHGVEISEAIAVGSGEGYAVEDEDARPDADLGVADADLDAAVATDEGSSYDEGGEGDAVEGDLEMDLEGVDDTDPPAGADDGASDSDATIEGDTVEGDLEMDLDAIDDADDATPGEDPDDPASTDEANARGGASKPGAGEERDASPAEATPTPEGEGGPDQSADPADESGDGAGGPDDSAADADENVEELTLSDPTEGDDETDDDERANWDIPGQ